MLASWSRFATPQSGHLNVFVLIDLGVGNLYGSYSTLKLEGIFLTSEIRIGVLLLLMVQKSGDHQLMLVVYPIVYRVLYIQGGAGFLPSTVGVPNITFSKKFNMLSLHLRKENVCLHPTFCLLLMWQIIPLSKPSKRKPRRKKQKKIHTKAPHHLALVHLPETSRAYARFLASPDSLETRFADGNDFHKWLKCPFPALHGKTSHFKVC